MKVSAITAGIMIFLGIGLLLWAAAEAALARPYRRL